MKQEWQKRLARTRQTDGKYGLVRRNRKKISQIIKDYFFLPFFLLIIFRAGHSLIFSWFAIRSPLNFFLWIADAHAFIF
jgi:hypothetical protein